MTDKGNPETPWTRSKKAREVTMELNIAPDPAYGNRIVARLKFTDGTPDAILAVLSKVLCDEVPGLFERWRDLMLAAVQEVMVSKGVATNTSEITVVHKKEVADGDGTQAG